MKTGKENKPHIGIYGRCNAGKSSLLNFITGADSSIISPEAGTTTDVVRRHYEILGFAPVVWLDTAGTDDETELGRQRVSRTMETLQQVDLALLVYREWGDPEREMVRRFEGMSLPYIIVRIGTSLPGCGCGPGQVVEAVSESGIPLCEAVGGTVIEADLLTAGDAHRDALLEAVKKTLPEKAYRIPSMFGDRIESGDLVLLVCPIDSEAPAGRLILPQVQAIRELLDLHAVPVVVQPQRVAALFGTEKTAVRSEEEAGGVSGCPRPLFGSPASRPKLVVTDSQVFAEVRRAVPEAIEVTSFSILLAAAKGDAGIYKKGLLKVDSLREGDRVLIAENCLHQVSCEDIGRVKIPRWLESYTGCKLRFTFISGLEPLPDDLAGYSLMVQCGGCMVTRSQILNRIRTATAAGVPVTNYGMLIRKVTAK